MISQIFSAQYCLMILLESRPTDIQWYIVDISVEIRAKAAILDTPTDITFKDFVSLVLNSIASTANTLGVQQLNIVADLYYFLSIKNSTREGRGMGPRTLFLSNDKLPDDFCHSLQI